MTDTPRTLAEIKALLASNTTHDISAQDLRDTVESIVDPVPGGGFDTPPESGYFANWRVAGTYPNQVAGVYSGGSPVATLTPANYNYEFALPLQGGESASSFFFDPDGWLVAGTWPDPDYNGFTHAAGSVVALPTGVYLWSVFVSLSPGEPGDNFGGLLDYAEAYFDSSDPITANYSTFGFSSLGAPNTTDFLYAGGFTVVNAGPTHFYPTFYWHHATNTPNVVAVGVGIQKVA